MILFLEELFRRYFLQVCTSHVTLVHLIIAMFFLLIRILITCSDPLISLYALLPLSALTHGNLTINIFDIIINSKSFVLRRLVPKKNFG